MNDYQEKYEKLLIRYKNLDKKYKYEVKKNNKLTFTIWHRFRAYLANLEGLLNLEEVRNSEHVDMYKQAFTGFSDEIKIFANKYAHEENEENNHQ